MKDRYPKRIICLTEETTETLYLLGEQDRIVGISGFTVRPKQARKEKPKVSTFLEANTDEIIALQPDLVIGFSDIQADIAKELISKGITVWVNNHRSVEEILDMIFQLGTLVGQQEKAIGLLSSIEQDLQQIQAAVQQWPFRPTVYFEEWYDPLITSIQWVSELVAMAGGVSIFKEQGHQSLAKDRIIADDQLIVEKNPDIILASWCGKMFKKKQLVNRPNWNTITAVKADDIHEIDSSIILQPGPAAVREGVQLLHRIFKEWVEERASYTAAEL